MRMVALWVCRYLGRGSRDDIIWDGKFKAEKNSL